MTHVGINALRDSIHAANVEAGWWTDLETGESILETRNRPEMLCLLTSELVEAWQDGFKPDSHLPDHPAFNIEIADAAIRLLDQAGADQIDLEGGQTLKLVGVPQADILATICLVSGTALEGYRKGKTEVYHKAMRDTMATLAMFGDVYDFDLGGAIQAKAEYNKNRADHKVENRKKDGGKKI